MRKSTSLLFGSLVVLFALFFASLPAQAGDCWGCHSFSCMQGFDAGGLFCEEVSVSCGFVYQLLGLNCEMRRCTTSGVCPRTASDRSPSIDPSVEGGDAERDAGSTGRSR